MATVPAKSHQPLHNFSLPFLKWGHRNHTTNANTRCRRLSSPSRHSSPSHRRLSEPDSDLESENHKPPPVRSRNRSPFFASCSSHDAGLNGELERVRDELDGEESAAKPWNLRPRKAFAKSVTGNTFPAVPPVPDASPKRKQKRKLWISLSREEIEEDIYSLTGSKPARRPKKRSKTIQKELDNLFPALYLVGITADSYRVLEK